MMENSHQECRIGDLLLLNFSIFKYLWPRGTKPCDVPAITTFIAKKSRPGIGPSIDSSTSMSSVRVSLPLNPPVDVRLRAVSLLLLVM